MKGVDVRVRMRVEIEQRAGGDEGFAAALTAGEDEGDAGDLLGDGVDGAIDPDDLLVGAGEAGLDDSADVVAAEPGESGGGEVGGFLVLDF